MGITWCKTDGSNAKNYGVRAYKHNIEQLNNSSTNLA